MRELARGFKKFLIDVTINDNSVKLQYLKDIYIGNPANSSKRKFDFKDRLEVKTEHISAAPEFIDELYFEYGA